METVKLVARYIIIVFVLYLCYKVSSLSYVNAVDNKNFSLNTIVTAVFGALTLIIKFHFDTKVGKNDDVDNKQY